METTLTFVNQKEIDLGNIDGVVVKPEYKLNVDKNEYVVAAFKTEDQQMHYTVSFQDEGLLSITQDNPSPENISQLRASTTKLIEALKKNYVNNYPENKDCTLRVIIKVISVWGERRGVYIVRPLNFKDVYKFPFELDDHGDIVYDKNRERAFDFEGNLAAETKSYQQAFIDIVNDRFKINKDNTIALSQLYAKNGNILIGKENDGESKHIATIRGFGHLTAISALNLAPVEARKLQDQLADYIVSSINSYTRN